MPQRRTAIKDLRKNNTRHDRNLDIKSDLRRTLKSFVSSVNEKKTDSKDLLKTLYKKFDKAAKRKILHPRTAARRKSRYAKLAQGLAAVAK
jgi:small subunit ribosomal protein S20